MGDIMKKNKKIVLLIMLLPLLVGIGVKIIDYIPFFNKIPGDNGDWIGFWASYLGTIVAILVAVWVAKHEANANKTEIEEQKTIQQSTIEELKKTVAIQSKTSINLENMSSNLLAVSENQKNITESIEKLRTVYIENFEKRNKIESNILINKRLIENLKDAEASIDKAYLTLPLYLSSIRALQNYTKKENYLNSFRKFVDYKILILTDIERIRLSVYKLLSITEISGIDNKNIIENTSKLILNKNEIGSFFTLSTSILSNLKNKDTLNEKEIDLIINEINVNYIKYQGILTETESLLINLRKEVANMLDKSFVNLPYKHHQ